MSEADGNVGIATPGPFKLEASCKTVTYEYDEYNISTNSTFTTFPADPNSLSSGGEISGNYSLSDEFWSDGDMNFTESFVSAAWCFC